MTARTKIDVHDGTLSMEFGDNVVLFNIFEAMKHPAEDHSIFIIDIINELVEEHMQIGTGSIDFSDFVEMSDVIDCFNFVEVRSDFDNMCDGVSECPRCANLRIATSKPEVTQVATIVKAESEN
ncbi:hypothetical protein CR513_43664, partial [Mucuna pruriens]